LTVAAAAVMYACSLFRKLMSGEITEVGKVEEEISKILSELSKRRSSVVRVSSEKDVQDSQLISWYAVEC